MKAGSRRFLFLLCLLTFAVVAAVSTLQAKKGAEQNTPHTTYYVHGRIYTNDPAQPWAEAMAVTDDKISCIGKVAHVLLDCGGSREGAETIHLHDQFVMPGFNDAHVHLGGAAADELAVPLLGVPSPQEMQKRVADAVAHHKTGEWITGGGWDHTMWPEKRFPNRQQLDAAAPKNPVILTHVSGHVAVANSLALKIAEIDKNTPNPPGGEIEHDALGEPTGMLKEGAAMSLVKVKIPFCLGRFSGLRAAQRGRQTYCPHHGVAAVRHAAQRFAEHACSGWHHRPVLEDRGAKSIHRWRHGFAHGRHARTLLRRSIHDRDPHERSRQIEGDGHRAR